MKNFRFILTIFLLATVMSAFAAPEPKTPLIVAQDGSGDFTTIQEAVYAVRDYTPVPITIKVRNGVYREKLVIPSWKCDITIEGENPDSTIITWGDYANAPLNFYGQQIEKMGTFRSHTVLVGGNRITLENLTIENTAGRVGQAVALHTEGTDIKVVKCRLLGNQDTLFTGNEESYVAFDHCYIEGTTDYIFGPASCWFEECDIHSKSDSYITAASTSAVRPYGYIFHHCRITADEVVTKLYLGRPWRAYASVVFMECELDAPICPAGWDNWRDPANEKTARYSEYRCTGKGADRSGRVAWARVLTPAEARQVMAFRSNFPL